LSAALRGPRGDAWFVAMVLPRKTPTLPSHSPPAFDGYFGPFPFDLCPSQRRVTSERGMRKWTAKALSAALGGGGLQGHAWLTAEAGGRTLAAGSNDGRAEAFSFPPRAA